MKVEFDINAFELSKYLDGVSQAYELLRLEFTKYNFGCMDQANPKICKVLEDKSDKRFGDHDCDHMAKILKDELAIISKVHNQLLEVEKEIFNGDILERTESNEESVLETKEGQGKDIEKDGGTEKT